MPNASLGDVIIGFDLSRGIANGKLSHFRIILWVRAAVSLD
jgi:hypothetical protein